MRRIEQLYKTHPVVAILGARQVGKTTLALQIAERFGGSTHRFDLEDPGDLARLDDPRLALGSLDGLVVIDEVQRRPDLFPVLRVLVDRPANAARFLVLGSASPDLLRQSSETLAGRIAYHELSGLALDEVGMSSAERLWVRGGFPRSFLAPDEGASFDWRWEFVRTFLERDVAQFGIQIPSRTLHRFWSMLAHYHGQTWNGAELGRAFGVSATTVRRYLDVLSATLVVRQLQPWHENLKKRQVKSPKVYITDSGVLHTLLGIKTTEDLSKHPKVGASWEGFVLNELLARLGARTEECFFWASHTGLELDLLVVRGRRRLGFEIKRTSSPKVTRSLRGAVEDLHPDRVDVIHAGDDTFPLAKGMRAVALDRLLADVEPLG
jgi:predicted AAA+ superfamily ATPase